MNCVVGKPISAPLCCLLACLVAATFIGACGGGGGGDCTPATCGELDKRCGDWDDGCGGTVTCPMCPAGQSCDAEGVCHQDCVPRTCEGFGKQCGTWEDGCGGTLTCPDCRGGQTCDAQGQCVGDCTPDTCQDLGVQCGSWEDGCGGWVDCPACPDEQRCGNDGQCVVVDNPGKPLFQRAGHYQMLVPAPSDDANISYVTDVYYPDPDDLASGNYRFPVALLLQGAQVAPEHYSGFAGWMARYGFVVMIPKRDTAMVDDFTAQSVVMDVAARLQAENEGAGPVAGMINIDSLVLVGHSHGGLCGVYSLMDECNAAAQCFTGFTRPAEVKGAAFYGTFVSDLMGTFPDITNDGLPLALIQGSLDGLTDPTDAQSTYAKIQDPPRAIVSIGGASHYGITDQSNPPGAIPDPNQPALDQALATETIARWTALFLRATVFGDSDAADYVFVVGDGLDPNAAIVFEQ